MMHYVTARNLVLLGVCTTGLLLFGGCETTQTAPADTIGSQASPLATRLITLPSEEANEHVYPRAAMAFSHDFSRIMYQVANQTLAGELRENDSVLETFENVGTAHAVRMAYSPDGRNRMYAVGLRTRAYFVVNGKQHPTYDYVHKQVFLQFSKSGDYIYAIGTWKETVVVRNGVVFQKIPNAIKKITISEDGQRITYLTRISDHMNTTFGDRIVTRDADGKERVFAARNMGIDDFETDVNHENVIYTELATVPDSPRVARLVYANGKRVGSDYQHVMHMGFTPKRKQPFFAYNEWSGWRLPYDPTKPQWKQKLGGGVVFAGHTSQFKEAVGGHFAVTKDEAGVIFFTRTAENDGWNVWEQNETGQLKIREKHFSVFALETDPHTEQLNICFREKGGTNICRVRGQITSTVGDFRGPIIYSPDHRSFAFQAIQDGKTATVLNGRVLRTHDQVLGNLVFTSEGRHLIYAAKRGPEIWRFVDPVVEAGS